MGTRLINRIHSLSSLDCNNLPPVVVISAPAGSGKTVLAQQIEAASEYKAIMHLVDYWQQDVKRLVEICHQTWQREVPDLCLKQQYTTHIQAAHALAQELKTHTTEPYLYMLDDVHYLEKSQEVGEWLQTLIDVLPSNIHMILVGRSLPMLDWITLLAQERVIGIDHTDLRFTAGDVQQMADISSDEAEELVEQYNGWAAAIRLALDPSLRQIARTSLGIHKPDEVLFQQLIVNFFQALTLERQHILLTTCVMQVVDPVVCEEILNLTSLDFHLKELQEKHLLISRTSNGYVYHDLLRSFLLEHLKHLQPERYRVLHLKSAQWYERVGHLERAVIYYLEAGATAQAVRLAESVAKELHMRGLWRTLLGLKDALVDTEAPRLFFVASLALTDSNQLEESDNLLHRAEVIFSERGDKEGVARVSLQRAYNQQLRGNYQAAISQLEALFHVELLPQLLESWTYRVLGCSYMGLGRYTDAIQAFENAVPAVRSEEKAFENSQILQDLSSAYLLAGEFEKAVAILQEVIALCRSNMMPIALAIALNNLGFAFRVGSQYEQAKATYEEARRLVAGEPSVAAGYVYHSIGDLYRDLGQFAEADYAYETAYRMVKASEHSLLRQIVLSRSQMALRQNQFYEASRWLEFVPLPTSFSSMEDRLLHIWHAVIVLHRDPDSEVVISLLHQVKQLQQQNAIEALSRVVGSIWYVGLKGKIQPILDQIPSLFGHLAAIFRQPLAADCHYLPGLQQAVQKLPEVWELIDPEYQILAQYPIEQGQKGLVDRFRLELKMLGRDEVKWNGEELANGQWASPQTRAFFYYLYFFGPQTKSQLGHQLWPEHNEHQVRNALRDVKQHLKRIFPGAVVYHDSLYLLHPDMRVQADVVAFEEQIALAQQLPERDARAETLYFEALHLYQKGGLLPYLYADWLEPLRYRYENLYLQAVEGAAKCAVARDDYTSAIRLYETFLETSPYEERIYQDMMRCQAQSGQVAQVQLLYNRLQQLFQKELQISPRPETTALLRTLLR